MTESNKKALIEYSQLHGEFKILQREFPADTADINRVKMCAEKLKMVAEKFDFDVPEDVKIFLAAVARGGATLDLLTNEVGKWLNQNQSEMNYRIVGNR
jgi:hypothetical protein